MQIEIVKTAPTNKGLIVYFAGWGTSPSVVSHLKIPANYDLLYCYDYQDLRLNFDFSAYQQIRVIAWSMGVWVADQVMRHIPILSATAINGTGLPCHDQFGIPYAIFSGTLATLTPVNLQKFIRRICGDPLTLAHYQSHTKQRDIHEIYQELTALSQDITHHLAQFDHSSLKTIPWDHAIIATQDRIFPADHQRAYWQSRCVTTEIAAAHYAFLHFTQWDDFWHLQ